MHSNSSCGTAVIATAVLLTAGEDILFVNLQVSHEYSTDDAVYCYLY